MRLNNELLAELLARYHNVHFHDRDSADPPLMGSDFLRKRNALDAADGDEDEAGDDGEEMGAPLHPMLQSGITGAAGIRPTGAVVPPGIMGLFSPNEGKNDG